ncbi:MAG: sugar ABC transporter ATP-binding protein [Mycobacterium sp.]
MEVNSDTGVDVLRVENLTKSFGATTALRDVSMTLRRGEIRAVVGPNGAGKSTLMKLLRGVYSPSSGRILLDGKEIRPTRPADADRLGIAMVYQELSVLPDLTVAENIVLGRPAVNRLGLLDRRRVRDTAADLVAKLGVTLPLDALCGELTVGQRQMVEILRALSAEARVLICDEPTAALSRPEQDHLMALLRRLRDTGVSILYVTHHLAEVFELADTVTVIRDGREIATEPASALDTEQLVRLMLGETATAEATRASGTALSSHPTPALSVSGLSTQSGTVADLNLIVRPGEIVGLAGTLGSGCSDVLRALFGDEPIRDGTVAVGGQQVVIGSPRAALRAGICLVPGDRKTQGIFPGQALWKNTVSARLSVFTGRSGLLRKTAAFRAASRKCSEVGVKADSMPQPIDSLSGGNQQKAILARALLDCPPTVLMLDDPTVGVDVGAKREIRLLLDSLAAEGVAILLVSSEFDELAAVCHRILVVRSGRVVDEFDGAHTDENRLLIAATGEQS